MYIKELTYKDYNGNMRTDKLMFNLNQVELVDMEIDKGPNGILGYLEHIQNTNNKAEGIRFIKELIRKSYGVKSDDGSRFIKSDKIWEEFSQTAAYPEMFALLSMSEVEMKAFIDGAIPADARTPVKKKEPEPKPLGPNILD